LAGRLGHRHPEPPEADPASRIHPCKSLGLRALLEALKPERSYCILDLGPAVGSNIEFLSQFASRIRVEDLFQTLVASRFFERNGEPVDGTAFSRLLSIPRDERFDIFLTWDLVNYFKPDELKELMSYLRTLCEKGSMIFAISSTLKEIPSEPTTFKILDPETLQYCPGSELMRPCPRYVPRDLVQMMSGFHIQSSFILKNGMQEYVFARD
jgi:hypothetical protein